MVGLFGAEIFGAYQYKKDNEGEDGQKSKVGWIRL